LLLKTGIPEPGTCLRDSTVEEASIFDEEASIFDEEASIFDEEASIFESGSVTFVSFV